MFGRFRARRLQMAIGLLMFLIILGYVGNPASAATKVKPAPQKMDIASIVSMRFDGKGFSHVVGEESTLESTLDALQLLEILNYTTQEVLKWEFSEIARTLKLLQDWTGAFKSPDDVYTSEYIKTTAQALSILRIMDEIDTDTRQKAERYLANFFRTPTGTQDLDDWLTEGVFEVKYWGLVAANALGNLRIIGIKPVSIEKSVLAEPDARGSRIIQEESATSLLSFSFFKSTEFVDLR